MAVVINDFEVVAEPAPLAEGQAEQAKGGSEKAEKRSLEEVLERFHERRERVRAH
jgi:hypothetical protein